MLINTRFSTTKNLPPKNLKKCRLELYFGQKWAFRIFKLKKVDKLCPVNNSVIFSGKNMKQVLNELAPCGVFLWSVPFL